MNARAAVGYLLLILVVAGGALAVLSTRPAPVTITINTPIPTGTALPTLTPAPITVYVSGAVANPNQTITLPYRSRVDSAVQQAGGFANNADTSRVNLAGILHDGAQVHVPALNETPMLPTPVGGAVVYINTATLEELVSLPEIGDTTAQAIIAYRDANGDFRTLEDLDNVEGIGEATLAAIAELVVFD